jgi:capsular polysaccharide biosynthesis protein
VDSSRTEQWLSMAENGNTGQTDATQSLVGSPTLTIEAESVGIVPPVPLPTTPAGDPGAPSRRGTVVRAGLAVLVAVVVAAGVGWAVHRQTPTFQATALIEMDQPLQLATNGDQVIVKLSRLRLKYAPLVATDAILQPLSDSLGVPIEQLRGSVSAQAPGETLLLVVTARTHNSSSATRYANGAADQLSRYVANEQRQLGVPAKLMYEAVVIDNARAAAKTAPTKRRVVEASAIFGLIAGAVAYSGLTMLRGRTRTA